MDEVAELLIVVSFVVVGAGCNVFVAIMLLLVVAMEE